ncbi:MAG TPA: cellulase family glycosylhydrolase, partial [Chthonomonadaceae bacterium]|nr:cellulase family glycosylhydrolase [Chthonomonadaceae bacterium]
MIAICVGATAPRAATYAAQQPTGEFTVAGGRILKNGAEFIIRGVSVAGPGLGQKHRTVLDTHLIADVWRFNLVRVGCSIKPRPGPADVNDLDEIVSAFTARGIVVLIDPRDHIAGYYEDPPNPPGSPSLTDLTAWYKAVAARYRANPNVWFEVMAGPGRREEKKESEPWREAHARVIAAIRGDAAARNIVVCEGKFRGDDAAPTGALAVPEASSAILTRGP